MSITRQHFGKTANETAVDLYTLENRNGVVVKITNYGAIITSLLVPANGELKEMVLGFDKLEHYLAPAYLENYPFFGAVIGRFANRIAKGQFELNGKNFQLACNLSPNHLHGGNSGFDKKIWEAEIIDQELCPTLQLTCTSPDGEENYPGNLKVTVTYSLTNDNELRIDYRAISDAATPINLTQHTYFNLTGGCESIHNHHLQMDAAEILDVDANLVPTGKTNHVKDSAYDFQTEKTLGKNIDEVNGYDNCYVLDREAKGVNRVALLSSPQKDIQMEVYTNSPSMQLYTGAHINVKGERPFGPYSGVALETQEYPDAPNHEHFPSCILNPGEEYNRQTIYKFKI
ncbi:MAG: aldose epimerase family protein [Marinifilaceae bacterium]